MCLGQTQDARDFVICMQRALIEELCRYIADVERRMRGDPTFTTYQGALPWTTRTP